MYTINKKVLRHDTENDDNIFINLPIVGEIRVKLVYRENKIEKQICSKYKCDFLTKWNDDNEEDSCLNVKSGMFGGFASGDAIITMHHMGYDLTNKGDLKKAKKVDKEKIQKEYKKLLKEQPDLFDESKIKKEAKTKAAMQRIKRGKGKISEKEYLREKKLIKKYGEKDGLRIYKNKISEKKYLEEKDKKKKKAAQKKNKAVKQKVLDTIAEKDGLNGFVLLQRVIFEDNPDKEKYNDAVRQILSYHQHFSNILSDKKFVQLVKELIEEGKLFTADTWNGETLPDWLNKNSMGYPPTGTYPMITVFTKFYAEEAIRVE